MALPPPIFSERLIPTEQEYYELIMKRYHQDLMREQAEKAELGSSSNQERE